MSGLPNQVVSLVDIDNIEVTEDNVNVLALARARLLETQCLMALAKGVPWPVATRLAPLSRAIDDFIQQVVLLNVQPIDVDDTASIGERLEMRERCYEVLDQARMSGVSLLLHLNTALGYTQASNRE